MSRKSRVKAVIFDVGETLINEERMWLGWAEYIGVSNDTLFKALDTAIRQRRHHWEALRSLRPGLDVKASLADRLAKGERMIFDKTDLYPTLLLVSRRCGTEATRLVSWAINPPGPKRLLENVAFNLISLLLQRLGASRNQIRSSLDAFCNTLISVPGTSPMLATVSTMMFCQHVPWA